MRLKLVGGWGTRGMRRFVEDACAEDPRITAGPGDPLEHLRTASLCVHPAYEDGFAYAPAEALACGVPVIVSEDTGMKELIELTARRPGPADRRSGCAHGGDRGRLPRLSCSAPEAGRFR